MKDWIQEAAPFTMPAETLKPATAWIDQKILDDEDIRLYQGSFKNEAGQVIEVPMSPQELCTYTRTEKVLSILEKLDLHRFFEAPLPAVDCKRVYELITSIKEDGTAEISDMDGEKMAVQITVQTVADALHLSDKGDLVTKRREELKVYRSKKRNYTYEDLHNPRVGPMCKL